MASLHLPSYGFFAAVGFLCAARLCQHLASRCGMDVARTMTVFLWVFVAGAIGCRLFFVITNARSFLASPADAFRIWNGGLVFYGGPIVGVPVGIWLARAQRLDVWRTADVLLPSLSLFHAFGRVGCLSAQCCYGKPTGTSFGVRLFSDNVEPALRGVYLHPAQLYEAGGLALLTIGLVWLHRRKSFDGQVALAYFMAYAVLRFIVEIFRGDSDRGFVFDGLLSTSQFISVLVFVASLGAVLVRRGVTNGPEIRAESRSTPPAQAGGLSRRAGQ